MSDGPCDFDITAHRQRMVAHFIQWRRIDPEYARWAVKQYISAKLCPCPDIATDVRRAWEEETAREGKNNVQP